MTSLTPFIKYVESFTITGPNVRTQNKNEFNEKAAKLPNLWQQFYSSSLATNTNIFGVYSDYASDANDLYTVTVGITSDEPQTKFSSVKVQTGNYLVFQSKGTMPATAIATWRRVWDYFEQTSAYQRNFISDFEEYNSPDEVAIYIGIK